MQRQSIESASQTLASLTAKQREVLNLVLQHKSSKEIARLLQISPYTVDQRISAARPKLAAHSRGEVARAYQQLLEICGETAYDFSYIDHSENTLQISDQEPSPNPVYTLSDVSTFELSAPWELQKFSMPGLEALDNRFGILGRVYAVFGLAALIVILFLAMASIAQTLTHLI